MSTPPCIRTTSKPTKHTLCALTVLLTIFILGFYTIHHPIPQTTLHQLFLSLSSNSTLSSYLHSLTLQPHLSGTHSSLLTSNYVVSTLSSFLPTHSLHFFPLLSFPSSSSLSLHFPNHSFITFSLLEKPGFGLISPYHAYSPSGSARAEVVFVNFGRVSDYHELEALNVSVSGRVVIARRGGGMSRAAVVEVAEAKGAVAVLLYSEWDKGKDGIKKSKEFWVGVERGTVMRGGIGDPLSPGWPAVREGERLGLGDHEVVKRFPKIPSLPLSFGNADVILGSLGGPEVPPLWVEGLAGLRRVGPGPTVIELAYTGENRIADIQNIYAVIRGSVEPDRYVILGNHRDAWTYGAVDPNSGTAALLDIARRYALLLKKGWTPRRTIILCSWDAEEFGMVGSTEWVEQNLVNLGARAVAYLNVDCAVQGPGFFAGATPQMDNLLLEVTKKVKDPDSEGETVFGMWAALDQVPNIQRLSGVDSDFAPFLQHAGVPSIDIYYGKDFPVYHTAFDSYEWITKNADPWFHRHMAVADIWGLLALHLADDSILPFNYLSYAKQLQEHTNDLSKLLDHKISLQPLISSIGKLISASREAADEAQHLREQEDKGDLVALKVRALNDRLMLAERGFLDADGLHGRQWFKHLIYGPSNDQESKLNFFPGIADAISRSVGVSAQTGTAAIQHEVWRVARAIERAASALSGELT